MLWLSGLSVMAQALAKPIEARLDQFKSLVGNWQGEGLGGRYEEHWLPAIDGSMIGVFCLTVQGQLRTVSVLRLRQQGAHVEMLLRGLSPELSSGDEKTSVMVLVERTGEFARFVNQDAAALPRVLTVSQPGGGLRVVVESMRGSEPTRTELNFRRARAGG